MFVLMAPQRQRWVAASAWLQMRAFMAPQKDRGGRIPLVSSLQILLLGPFCAERYQFLRGSSEVCFGPTRPALVAPVCVVD